MDTKWDYILLIIGTTIEYCRESTEDTQIEFMDHLSSTVIHALKITYPYRSDRQKIRDRVDEINQYCQDSFGTEDENSINWLLSYLEDKLHD